MKRTALISFLLLVVYPSAAFAYVDPNTGGYVFQILFPVVSAITAGYIFFRNKIGKLMKNVLSLFRNKGDR